MKLHGLKWVKLMNLTVEKPLSYQCFMTKINAHTFLLENVLTHQIWHIQILNPDSVDSLKKQDQINLPISS